MRPLSVGELLDQIFTSYRSHFGLFVGIMLPLALCQSLISLVILLFQNSILIDQENPDFAMAGLFLVAVFAMAAVSILIYAVAVSVTTAAFGEVHFGRSVSIRLAYSLVKGRLLRVLGLTLVFWAMVMGAAFIIAIVVIIPAAIAAAIHPALGFVIGVPLAVAAGAGTLFLLSRLGVSVPALVLERNGLFSALRRSTLLVKGFEFRVILIVLLASVIQYAAAFLLQGPFLLAAYLLTDEGGAAPLWTQVGQAAGGGAGMALIGPLLSIGVAVLYFDLRVRKEALDLEVAIQESAQEPVFPAPQ